jgi:hypothetical protein
VKQTVKEEEEREGEFVKACELQLATGTFCCIGALNWKLFEKSFF